MKTSFHFSYCNHEKCISSSNERQWANLSESSVRSIEISKVCLFDELLRKQYEFYIFVSSGQGARGLLGTRKRRLIFGAFSALVAVGVLAIALGATLGHKKVPPAENNAESKFMNIFY